MAKIPFDIKYRSQIESGEYRVVTRVDRPVEIKIWDLKGEFPVVGVYYDEKNDRDTAVQVTAEGRCSIDPEDGYCDDFFIITDKPVRDDLEEEIRRKIEEVHRQPCYDLKDFARHFTNWQKQQMMKDAVEAVSCTFSNSSSTFLRIEDGLDTKDGDKVKLIIIKED